MNTAVVIPALDPEASFIQIVEGLNPSKTTPIIVIDDGSAEDKQYIFEALEKMEDVVVLHHGKNLGKGQALRTGFHYFYDHCHDLDGVVTADCDGQHTLSDIKNIASHLKENQDAIVLGIRDFKSGNVPFKSYFGNKLSAILFKYLYGKKISDTQTGLRGIPSELIPWLLTVPGDRFEYEMYMLTYGCRKGIDFLLIPIETVYYNNNEGTHYSTSIDSKLIAKSLFGGFSRFVGSAVAASLVDYLTYLFLLNILFQSTSIALSEKLLFSIVIARVISSIVNYTINRQGVFKSTNKKRTTIIRYYILWCVLLASSYVFTLGLSSWLHLSPNLLKIIVDFTLSISSYQVQMKWVFANQNPYKSE